MLSYDKLNRNNIVQKIKTILDNSEKYCRDMHEIDTHDNNDERFNDSYPVPSKSCDKPKPFVLALNGQWGQGKTKLIEILAKEYKKENEKDCDKTLLIYYNAWSEDYFGDPLFSLVSQILNDKNIVYCGIKSTPLKKTLKNIWKKLGPDLIEASGTIGKVAKVAIEGGQIVYAAIKEDLKEELPDFIKKKQKAVENIRKGLFRLVKEDLNPIIIIDELDRCNPNYAIQVLEIVKHILNVRGVRYVFSLDADVLTKTLSNVYHDQLVVGNYLNRFFDIRLDLRNNYKDTEFLKESFSTKCINNEKLIEFMLEIAMNFDLPLREINTVVNEFKILYESDNCFKDETLTAQYIALFFLSVKYKFPDKYKVVFDGKWNDKEYDNAIKQIYINCSQKIRQWLVIDLRMLDKYVINKASEIRIKNEIERIGEISKCHSEFSNLCEYQEHLMAIYNLKQIFKNDKDEIENGKKYEMCTIATFIDYKIN